MLESTAVVIAAEPLSPVAIIGGGLIAILIIWIGSAFLWDKKYRPMRMKKGSPTPKFNNILKRVFRFLFKEDTSPSEKIKQPFLNKLMRWRNFYFLMLIVIGVSIALSMMKLMGGLILLLVLVVMTRVQKVFSARNKILSRMFEVSNSEFKYPRGSDLNPWGWVDIRQWDQLTTPAQTVVSFPASWSSEDPRNREKFERHFNGTVTDDNTWIYKWDTPNGVVTCEPVSHIPKMAAYPGSEKRVWDEIPLGVGPEGEVVWRPSVDPHLLICGGTGGGKSVAQRNIIFHIIQHSDQWKFLGVDLKRVELSAYEPYQDAVLGIAKTLEDGVEVMRYGKDEMMRRYEEMEGLGARHFMELLDPPPALMIMIDEAYMFMSPSGVKTDEGKEQDNLHGEATTLIGEIARLGRAAGVHLVIATQRPDAKVIYGEIKENLAVRYAAGRMKTTASLMVLDSDAATRIPGDVKGRAVISVNGFETMLQGYFAQPGWIDEWIAKRDSAEDEGESTDIWDKSAPKKKKKRGISLRKKAHTEDMAPVPDLENGEALYESKYPVGENTPRKKNKDASAQQEIESLIHDVDIENTTDDFDDDDFIQQPKSNAAKPVQQSFFDDEEDDNEDAFNTAPPSLYKDPLPDQYIEEEEEDPKEAPYSTVATTMGRPLLTGVSSASHQEDAWDDDLDAIFADIPQNTPAERPSEASMRPRATLSLNSGTGANKNAVKPVVPSPAAPTARTVPSAHIDAPKTESKKVIRPTGLPKRPVAPTRPQ